MTLAVVTETDLPQIDGRTNGRKDMMAQEKVYLLNRGFRLAVTERIFLVSGCTFFKKFAHISIYIQYILISIKASYQLPACCRCERLLLQLQCMHCVEQK